jgi:hypothetical protein
MEASGAESGESYFHIRPLFKVDAFDKSNFAGLLSEDD